MRSTHMVASFCYIFTGKWRMLQLSREGTALQYCDIDVVPEWTLNFQHPALDARRL